MYYGSLSSLMIDRQEPNHQSQMRIKSSKDCLQLIRVVTACDFNNLIFSSQIDLKLDSCTDLRPYLFVLLSKLHNIACFTVACCTDLTDPQGIQIRLIVQIVVRMNNAV